MIKKVLMNGRKKMIVQLKCFSTLTSPEKCNFTESTAYELAEGQTIENLIKLSGINIGDVKIAFVNSHVVGFDAVLKDGDMVGLAPTVSALKSPFSCINKAASVNCGKW
jgi:molybdopterin converting factor small subunit